jgi:hypothetical protein
MAYMLPLLARSGIARAALAHILRTADYTPGGKMAAQFRQSADFASNVVAVVAYLLDDTASAPAVQCFARTYDTLPSDHGALLDSHLSALAAQDISPRRSVWAGPSRQPARHRLIIVDALEDPQKISLLFAGASRVTVFSPTDLYGKLSFDDVCLHAHPAEITVAHPRSRITRFSARYHELHEETRQVAQAMIAELEHESAGFLGESAPYLEMLLADKLFFSVLSSAAFEDFVSSDEFDQIIIAGTGAVPHDRFLQSLASGLDLGNDPRIELTTLATSPEQRKSFGSSMSAAPLSAATAMPNGSSVLPRSLSDVLREADKTIGMPARKMRVFPRGKAGAGHARGEAALRAKGKAGAPVLYITMRSSAYDASSGHYLDILSRHYNTLTGFMGVNILAFAKSLPEGVLPPPANRIQLLPIFGMPQSNPLQACMSGLVTRTQLRLVGDGSARLVAHALRVWPDEIASGTLVAGFLHWINLQRWFDKLRATGRLPGLVVVSPLRPPLAGMAAAAARRAGVPSLGLESHGLNASYCRYAKVGTDRYGVITGFFRKETTRGFGITADRVDVIGSPRLRAPASYDYTARRLQARAKISSRNPEFSAEAGTLIPFFTQPSNWDQISEVWKIILSSVRDLQGVRLLLQPHPEEGPARLSGYQAIAEELGMADRVTTVDASAIEVIEAADLVLACYSATIVEAALYRKPVFAVKDGDGDYPLNQNEVVGAPMFRDAESLRQGIAAFLTDPAPFHKQAEDFLAREPQLITGPEPRLVEVVDAMLARPASENLRPPEDLPKHLFIDGPHRVFDV